MTLRHPACAPATIKFSKSTQKDKAVSELQLKITSYFSERKEGGFNDSNLLTKKGGCLPTLYSKARKYSVFTHKKTLRSFREPRSFSVKHTMHKFPDLSALISNR